MTWCQEQGLSDRLHLTLLRRKGESPAPERSKTGSSPYTSPLKQGVQSTILPEKTGLDHFLPTFRPVIGRKAHQVELVAYLLSGQRFCYTVSRIL